MPAKTKFPMTDTTKPLDRAPSSSPAARAYAAPPAPSKKGMAIAAGFGNLAGVEPPREICVVAISD
jgi:hypothetical protein